MANTPSFIAKQGTRVSTSGTLEFTAKQDSKIYHAMCKNSTAMSEAKLEITVTEEAEDVALPTIQYSHRWERLPNEAITISLGSLGFKTTEGFGHSGYAEIPSVNIELPGTFPLPNNTNFSVTYTKKEDGQNDITNIINFSFNSGATIEAVATRIFNRLTHELSQTYSNIPSFPFNFTYLRNGFQRIYSTTAFVKGAELNGSTADNPTISIDPNSSTLNPIFSRSINGNIVTFNQTTEDAFGTGVLVPNNERYLKLSSSRAQSTQTNYGYYFNANGDLNAINSNFDEFNGEAGTSTDPYVLLNDVESQLSSLIIDGNPIHNSSILITDIKKVVTGGTLPVVSDHTFTATGADIDLISDASVNTLFLTDVHGNKYLPLEKGQKLKITAPATNIALIYGEE